MPFRTRFVRPFANHVINPITRRFAGYLPGFAILAHVGRRSGRIYRIPINLFVRGDRYVFALTYGSRVDWVQNVLASGVARSGPEGRSSGSKNRRSWSIRRLGSYLSLSAYS